MHPYQERVAELKLEVGSRVAPFDADAPTSIPAYRKMRGTVIAVSGNGVRVKWDTDSKPEPYYRNKMLLKLAE